MTEKHRPGEYNDPAVADEDDTEGQKKFAREPVVATDEDDTAKR